GPRRLPSGDVRCSLPSARLPGTPYLQGNIGDRLRERPPMTPGILDGVLPFSEGHIRWRFQDSRATLPSVLEMLVDVFDVHSHVLAYLAGARRPELSARAAQHDGAFSDGELRMADAAARARGAQVFLETEGAAEPIDRLLHVFVDEDRYHRGSWCGAVHDHQPPPVEAGSRWKEIRFFSQASPITPPLFPSGSIE